MPNISAYNCADYEVNLSATGRMSSQQVSQSVAHSFIHSVTVSRAGIMARFSKAKHGGVKWLAFWLPFWIEPFAGADIH